MKNLLTELEVARNSGSMIDIIREMGSSYEQCHIIITDVYVEGNIVELTHQNGILGIPLDGFTYDNVENGFISENENVYTFIGIHVHDS